MRLHRLNLEGVDQFTDYLAALRNDAKRPFPPELISDRRFAEQLESTVEVQSVIFSNKFEAGQYLVGALAPVSQQMLRSDVGLWSWLAAWFFDQLCPSDGSGRRKPKEAAKYIPRRGDHRFGLDKHLLFFPWKMYQLHGQTTRFLLEYPLPADNRAQREWTISSYLNQSTQLLEACRLLYWDEEKRQFRRGSLSAPRGGRRRNGGLRRFMEVAKQLEVTYDLFGMSATQILDLLPEDEFKKWRREG